MMAQEIKNIGRNGIRFLKADYFDEALYGLKEKAIIKYSLFDLSYIKVYSTKGEFLCIAHRVQKVHPMARVLGTVKEMEEYKYQYQKQQQLKHRLIKQVKKTFPKEEIKLLEIEAEPALEIEEFEQQIEEKKSFLKEFFRRLQKM